MSVLDEILTERHRQLFQREYSRQHDDEHADGEIITAPWGAIARLRNPSRASLIQAAALIVAEIERVDRASLAAS